MAAAYIPLRIFSGFSILEGAIEPKDIAAQAAELGFPAVALCDRNGLYGSMAFADACLSANVQPIIGALLSVKRPAPDNTAPLYDSLALYAQNETGYTNLSSLVSAAHLKRPEHEEPHIRMEDLAGKTEGLLALSGGMEGAINRLLQEQQNAEAQQIAEQLKTYFPDRFFIELGLTDLESRKIEQRLVALAEQLAVPLVAVNPVHYVQEDFHKAHDALLCIASKSTLEQQERPRSSPRAWLMPSDYFARRFAEYPDALENTKAIAQSCTYVPPKRDPILPSLAGDKVQEQVMLREAAAQGLAARLAILPQLDAKAYGARLQFELDVIISMGFAGYFLIVADFIQWAKQQDIPVGPGRGSGAGSLVAWALTITDIDPIELGLLFERFLNPERVSMPDFDIDFCETRRGEVIRYTQEKYGADHVAQIITFGRLKSRAVLKDTGRVLSMSYNQLDRLAKLIPATPADPWTLGRALNGVSELAQAYQQDGQVKQLFDLAQRLEGLPRNIGTHAAGVVIGDRPLEQLVPLYRDMRSDMPVTQFDMKYTEAAGLVKFDFLGLKTLSVIHRTLQLVKVRTGVSIDFATLGWGDAAVYKLLQRGDTVGVFQLESEGMRRALSSVKPSCFADIIALVALYRPGPMDNIGTFGARKNGKEAITYPHPLLEPILKETYGVIVYQEQVMQAAQILADYSLGEADLLRRAMGKKIQSEMDAQRSRFVEGAARIDIDARKADELFNLIDKFAGYGFNKSHAAAYAVLSYQTAWLKVHYPHEFYAATMSYDQHDTDKLNTYVDDMRRLGHKLLPPCIHASAAEFSVEAVGEELNVRYALGALKGVGVAAMRELVALVQTDGTFTSLEDFATRLGDVKLNRKQIESLAAAGAFDTLGIERHKIYLGAEAILAAAASAQNTRTSGQHALFGDTHAVSSIPMPADNIWAVSQRMKEEKEAFGFYFSAHPLDKYKAVALTHGVRSFAQLAELKVEKGARSSATVLALAEGLQWRTSAKGRRYLILKCSDTSGQFEASCFDEAVSAELEKFVVQNASALLTLELDRQGPDDPLRLTIKSAKAAESLVANTHHNVIIEVSAPEALAELADILRGEQGHSTLVLQLERQGGKLERLELGANFSFTQAIIEAMRKLEGVVRFEIVPVRSTSPMRRAR
jgi:DNA polymerase III subunit alpha